LKIYAGQVCARKTEATAWPGFFVSSTICVPNLILMRRMIWNAMCGQQRKAEALESLRVWNWKSSAPYAFDQRQMISHAFCLTLQTYQTNSKRNTLSRHAVARFLGTTLSV
jgi:hypothetical protein